MNLPISPQYEFPQPRINISRHAIVGGILLVALVAFEIFNFDTTRFALQNLLGDVNFGGMGWAAILAVAFCAIDFAGLAKIFTPERGWDEPKEVWYLMGAWLLGATMNAIMTWWAVSLTLLQHDFGNEVLSRAQLLKYVPVFVAMLVWLTRILFIGALSVTGETLFANRRNEQRTAQPKQQQRKSYASQKPSRQTATLRPSASRTQHVQQAAAENRDTVLYAPDQLPLQQQVTPARNVRPQSSKRPAGPPRSNRSARVRPSVAHAAGQRTAATMQSQHPFEN